MIELERLLKEKGHEVAIFAMQHPLNNKSEYSEYFPEEVELNRQKPKNLIPALLRPFGSPEVRKKFKRILDDFKPDIVHLNNIHSHLSPILAAIAKKRNLPVIWTLHDHKLLCPRYDCIRDHKPCELCFNSKYNVVYYKCIKNSLLGSIIAYGEAIAWNRKRVSRIADLFICPSKFLLNNMIKGGFSQEKLINLPNFINYNNLTCNPVQKEHYYCYVGRLSSEKGVETLLKAAIEMPQYQLKIIGSGPLEEELKKKYSGEHLEFLGFRRWTELKSILEKSRCMVIPSECYENNPLSVIESLCLGTPVIGADIGGIPELINPGINGFTFEPRNVADLKDKISKLYSCSDDFNYEEIAKTSIAKFNSKSYYIQLMAIYNRLIE
jgi:glycosyltransferase involved in cell wall biosynthesis